MVTYSTQKVLHNSAYNLFKMSLFLCTFIISKNIAMKFLLDSYGHCCLSGKEQFWHSTQVNDAELGKGKLAL